MKNSIRDFYKTGVALLLFWMFGGLTSTAQGQLTDSLPNYAAGHELYPVDLETVLRLSGANSLTIKEYRLLQELAQEKQRTAGEWLYPELFAGVQLDGRTGSAMNADGRFFRDIKRNRAWAGADLELRWKPGEAVYKQLAARQELEAAKFQLQAERNKAVLAAVHAYLDLENAQLRYNAFNRLLRYSQRIARQLEVQVESGLEYKSEYLLAQSNDNSLQVSLSQAQQAIYFQSARLAELLALPDAALLLVSNVTVPARLGLIEQIEATSALYDSAYSLRPELQYYSRKADALHQLRRQYTTGLLLPSLELKLNNGLLGPYNGIPRNNNEVLGDKRFENTFDAAVYLGWHLPLAQLFSGGQRRQLDVQLKLQQNQYQLQKNQVQREVSQARLRYLEGQHQVGLAEEAARYAEQALDQSTERQKLGTARPFEVFQAQEIYIRAMLNYLTVMNDYNKAQYSLYVASGNDL